MSSLSFSGLTWNVHPKIALASHSHVARPVLHALAHRGITDAHAIDHFLNPSFATHVHDPFLFREMEKAVTRLFEALGRKEKIVIHGDYDADGISGSAILYTTLRALGGQPEVYLPHREQDGYGLSMSTVLKLADEGTNIIITCDCGIANINEITRAKELGIDVIITDHHQFKSELPPAFAILHPKLPEENYPDQTLSGGGVAFKLAQGLLQHAVAIHWSPIPIDTETFTKSLLDLVAISSVADMVPLLGETRALVAEGLRILANTQRIGLSLLIKKTRAAKEPITAATIGYYIAPRINAPGRLANPRLSFDLLTAKNEINASAILEEIELVNTRRGVITNDALRDARLQVTNEHQAERPIMFVYSDLWSSGILGLIAGRLKDEFNRPVLAMCRRGNDIVGSGRSTLNINLVSAMEKIPHYFSKFGGHPQACGFSLASPEILPYFEEALYEIIAHTEGVSLLSPELLLDDELSLSEITPDLPEMFAQLEPHGMGNEKPLFFSSRVNVKDARTVGSTGKTLLVTASQENGSLYKFVGFGKSKFSSQFHIGENVDVAYSIGNNEWNGKKEIQLSIKDMRISN